MRLFDSMPYEDANDRSQRYWDIGFRERQEGVEAPKATIYGGKPAFSRPAEESFGGRFLEKSCIWPPIGCRSL